MKLYDKSYYNGMDKVEYITVKLTDFVDFLKSDKCIEWLRKNGSKKTRLNNRVDYNLAYQIFLENAEEDINKGKEYVDKLLFSNFKKLFGSLAGIE